MPIKEIPAKEMTVNVAKCKMYVDPMCRWVGVFFRFGCFKFDRLMLDSNMQVESENNNNTHTH